MSSGRSGHHDGVEPARPHARAAAPRTPPARRGWSGRAARRRCRSAAVVGPAHPLQEGGEAARRADLAHQLDRADVDAQLERCRGHQGAQVPGPQPRLDPLAALLGQAAVVRGHLPLAEPFAQLVRDPLGHAAGVDEHQRGPVRRPRGRRSGPGSRHLLRGGDRAELVVGQLEGQVQLPAVAGVHDRAPRRPVRVVPVGPGADQQPGDGLDRPLGGGQADPLRPAAPRRASSRSSVRARCEPRLLPATAWISSTMTVRAQRSMDRLRSAVTSRYSDSGVVIRMSGGRLSIAGALGRGRVPGPDRDTDRRRAQPEPCGDRLDLAQAAPPGSAGCRWPAPSAATRTPPAARIPAARPPTPSRGHARSTGRAACESCAR